MRNQIRETLMIVAATVALSGIVMSSARAQDISIPTDADIADQSSAFTATIGDNLFALNSATLPTPAEVRPVRPVFAVVDEPMVGPKLTFAARPVRFSPIALSAPVNVSVTP